MTLVALYRALVPKSSRESFWYARHAMWQQLTKKLPRAWRQFVADRRIHLGLTKTSVLIDGIRLHIDLRDNGIGLPLFVVRSYEPRETSYFRDVLRSGQVFIDIGANIGYYATLAARQVGPTGRVLAIEPEPYNFDLLCRNIKGNHLTNVIAANVALGDAPNTALLFCSPKNFGDHRLYADTDAAGRTATTIAVNRLDDLVTRHQLPPVDFVKMDVQGYECQVLAGMQSTLKASPKVKVLTEFWPEGMRRAGGDPAWYFATFEQLGFSAYSLTDNHPGPQVSYGEALRRLPRNPDIPDSCYINLLFARPDT
jgi:FkbM family methyltransferase